MRASAVSVRQSAADLHFLKSQAETVAGESPAIPTVYLTVNRCPLFCAFMRTSNGLTKSQVMFGWRKRPVYGVWSAHRLNAGVKMLRCPVAVSSHDSL